MLGRGLIGVVLCVFPAIILAGSPTVNEVQKATTVPDNVPDTTTTPLPEGIPRTAQVPVKGPTPTVSPPLPTGSSVNTPDTVIMKKAQPQPTQAPQPSEGNTLGSPSGALNPKKTIDSHLTPLPVVANDTQKKSLIHP